MVSRLPNVGSGLRGALSLKISVISFLAAVAVAFLHFSQWLPTESIGVAIFRDAIAREATFFSVSFFFMLSGFLLTKNYDGSRSWYATSLTKRMRTLLLPYLFWGVLGGAAITFVCGRTHSWPHEVLFWLGVNPKNLMPRFFSLWYVRNLMFLCLLSPLLIRGVLWIDTMRILRGLAIAAFVCVSMLDFACKDQFVMSTAYFCVGIYLAFHFQYVRCRLCLVKVGLTWTVLCALKCLVRYYPVPTSYVHALHWTIIPVTIVFLWALYDWLLGMPAVERLFNKGSVRYVLSLSFPLYVVHTAVMAFVPGDRIVAQTSFWYPFVMTLISLAFVLIWVSLFKWICPAVNRIAFGGRS